MKNIRAISVVVFILLSSILSIVDSSEISNNIPPVADADGPYEGSVSYPVNFSGSAYNGTPPYKYGK